MGSETLILVGLALIFGLYMAWNIGANDVANAMGTSVGSGALTLKRAVILAAVMEFCGAFLVGPHVSETVRKGIVDPADIQVTEVQKAFGLEATPDKSAIEALAEQAKHDVAVEAKLREANRRAALVLSYGMIASLLAAGIWLQIASYFGWPVSTTHSIVGAIVGFGVVYGGIGAVNWFGEGTFSAIFSGKGGVVSILASWVVSPLLSGTIAFVIFRLVLTGIFYKPDPLAAAKKGTPYIVFAVMVTMTLVLAFKGLKPFWKNLGYHHLDALPLTIGLTGGVVAGILGALISRMLVGRLKTGGQLASEQAHFLYVSRALSKAIMHLRRARNSSWGKTKLATDAAVQQTKAIYREVRGQTDVGQAKSVYPQVERIFVCLQVISAGFVAFAHGANDVANAIGPLSVVVETARTMQIPEKASVPLWMLGLGGVGIVLGLATWGWRVIATVGKRITELTPSRGFCAEFAAAMTILLASVYKLPVSTTHCLVGAVLGVGLARGIGALNLRTVRDIVVSWIVTVPAGAGLTILFFYILSAVFGR